MVVHRDAENGFAIWHAKDWKPVEGTFPATKFRVVDRDGEGPNDLSVVVVADPAFLKVSAERMVAMMLERPDALLAQIRNDYPDATITKTGETKLDNRPAYYVVCDGTFRSHGISVPLRMIQVAAIHKGRAYYITCRTGPSEYDALEPTFLLLMGGFRFLDR